MARSAITVTTLTPNAGTLLVAAQSGDTANGNIVSFTTTGVPAPGLMDRLLLICTHGTATPQSFVIRAGVGGGATPGPAFRSGIAKAPVVTSPTNGATNPGDLAVSITNATTQWIGPLDPSRYAQLDGSIWIDFQSGTTTPTIQPVLVPRSIS